MRRGSVSSSIISPLARHLKQQYDDLTVLGGCRVETIVAETLDSVHGAGKVTGIKYSDGGGEVKSLEVDACVVTVGAKGLRGIMARSDALARLAPELSRASALGSIDCLSARIWLDRVVPTRSPANVWSRFDSLQGAGGTIFMLDQLQGLEKSWGRTEGTGSVVACDFYNAAALFPLSDRQLVDVISKELLPAVVPAFR